MDAFTANNAVSETAGAEFLDDGNVELSGTALPQSDLGPGTIPAVFTVFRTDYEDNESTTGDNDQLIPLCARIGIDIARRN